MNNLITDVPGLRVGAAQDLKLASGTTVVVFDAPATAGDRHARRRAGVARRGAARARK